ncbi:hypothetical protein Goshw_020734, partial [Gossypium schwendimanii]|nr:hypothetical protein [Gossypium schwendimanii]
MTRQTAETFGLISQDTKFP